MNKHTSFNVLGVSIAILSCVAGARRSDASLVANWTMNNSDVSGTTIIDVVNGFNGTATNGGPTTGVTGFLGQAAEFAGGANNGSNQFIDLGPHAATAATLSQGTVAAWIRPDTAGLTSDVLTIFSVSDSTAGSVESRFWVSNGGAFGTGTLAYGVRGGSANGSVFSGSATLLDGNWHHVAVTVDAVQLATIYIDGVAEGSSTIGFLNIPGANAAAIGRNLDSTAGGGQWFYDGLIDDVQLYDTALSAGEISALASVPEPSASLLLMASLVGIMIRRRR
jgi:hypothetical protein